MEILKESFIETKIYGQYLDTIMEAWDPDQQNTPLALNKHQWYASKESKVDKSSTNAKKPMQLSISLPSISSISSIFFWNS